MKQFLTLCLFTAFMTGLGLEAKAQPPTSRTISVYNQTDCDMEVFFYLAGGYPDPTFSPPDVMKLDWTCYGIWSSGYFTVPSGSSVTITAPVLGFVGGAIARAKPVAACNSEWAWEELCPVINNGAGSSDCCTIYYVDISLNTIIIY